jgi:AraC-like DNA-binding protein
MTNTLLLEQLRELLARKAQAAGPSALLEGLSLRTTTAPTEPIASVCEPVFALVVQGAKRTTVADRAFEYRAGSYLVVSVDLPVICRVTEASDQVPFLGFGLTLRPEVIASLMLEVADHNGQAGDGPGVAEGQAAADLLESSLRLLRLLDQPDDIPVLRPMIEREIVWRLLGSPQGAVIRQIGLMDSQHSRLSRALGYLRQHFAEPLRTQDLADQAAMSLTSFHRHFRTVTAMSPLQYQKQIRLQEARTCLLAGIDDVATVGLSVGYESPSQFSREYARMFGAPPARDVARIRATLRPNT